MRAGKRIRTEVNEVNKEGKFWLLTSGFPLKEHGFYADPVDLTDRNIDRINRMARIRKTDVTAESAKGAKINRNFLRVIESRCGRSGRGVALQGSLKWTRPRSGYLNEGGQEDSHRSKRS